MRGIGLMLNFHNVGLKVGLRPAVAEFKNVYKFDC